VTDKRRPSKIKTPLIERKAMQKQLLVSMTALAISMAVIPVANAFQVRTTDEAVLVLAAYIAEQTPEQTTANDFIGQTVTTLAGDNIGEVNNLVIAPDGGVVAAVVGVGGFLGIGEKNVAVPTGNIVVSRTEGGTLRLTTTETSDTLKAAPEFMPISERHAAAQPMIGQSVVNGEVAIE
jgi:sporulation protein YlmC with PRC-barrel domain